MRKQTRRNHVPEYLRGERVSLPLAVQISGEPMSNLRRAIKQGRLRAAAFPGGTMTHYEIRLGDLAEFVESPLPAEWLAFVEQCLDWMPGQEVPRAA